MGPPDPDIRLPLPDDLSVETVAALCNVLRDLADAIENRYADRLLVHRRREHERDVRAGEHHGPIRPDEPPF